MKTREFIGVYDYYCDDEDMDYLIYTLSRTHCIDWNDGCSSLMFINDDIYDFNYGNVETFEYYNGHWYHHNQYLIQRNATEYSSNDHYARISRVDSDITGHIREMSIHMMIEFCFNYDEYMWLTGMGLNQGQAWVEYRRGKQCDHIDNNRHNNHYMNLEMIPTEDNRLKGMKEHLTRAEIEANEANWIDCDESNYFHSIINRSREERIRAQLEALGGNEDE